MKTINLGGNISSGDSSTQKVGVTLGPRKIEVGPLKTVFERKKVSSKLHGDEKYLFGHKNFCMWDLALSSRREGEGLRWASFGTG